MKFSVITVCINCSDTIEKTIQSVLSQNGIELEYIIIDGNSSDGTREIIKKYEAQLAYWISEPDNGIFDAMNKGLRVASGDVISFLNAGDYYTKNILSEIQKIFLNKNIRIVSGSISFRIDNEFFTIINSDYNLERMPLHMIPHQALFTKREVFNETGLFDTNYRLGSDYDWFLKVWIKGIDVFIVPNICADCDGNGVTTKYPFNLSLETKQSALKQAKYMDAAVCQQIERYYESKLEKVFYEQLYEEELDPINIDFINTFLKDTDYYIWGMGRAGIRCYKIFKKNKIGIKGFIDNYKYETLKKVRMYNVYSPKEIDRHIKICIATREHESEVEKQVISLGYTKKDYVLFSEIVKQAVIEKTGKVYEKDHKMN